MDIANIIQTVAIYALPVLFAITLHEAAHGYVARYFGDDTAWILGRVTLNPIKHIDPAALQSLRMVYRATIVSGRLTHEAEGSSDEARWVRAEDIATLDHVALVDHAVRAAHEPDATRRPNRLD